MERIIKTWILVYVIHALLSTATSYTTPSSRKQSKVQQIRYITNWGKYKLPKVVHVKDLTSILEQVANYKQMKYCPFRNKEKCLHSDLDAIIGKIIDNYFSWKSKIEIERNKSAQINKNDKKRNRTKSIKKGKMMVAPTDGSKRNVKVDPVKKSERIARNRYFMEEPIFNHNYRRRMLKLELISEPSKKQLSNYRPSHNREFAYDLTREDNNRKYKKNKRFQRATGSTPMEGCGGRRRWIRTKSTKTAKVKTTNSSDVE